MEWEKRKIVFHEKMQTISSVRVNEGEEDKIKQGGMVKEDEEKWLETGWRSVEVGGSDWVMGFNSKSHFENMLFCEIVSIM